VPQIEVNFDIDANGILSVSAKDKATGKQQSIVIRASSGLADDEIDRMVKDAEAHAAEDQKFHEMVDARNQADNLIHATNKSLKELGDKVQEQERKDIEEAIASLQELVKGDDKDAIVAKTQALAEISGKLAERVYKEEAAKGDGQGPDAGGAGPGNGAAGGPGGNGSAGAEDVVDAEFEEVKDGTK